MTPNTIQGNQLKDDDDGLRSLPTQKSYDSSSQPWGSDCDDCDFYDDGIRMIPVEGSEVQGLSRLLTSGS